MYASESKSPNIKAFIMKILMQFFMLRIGSLYHPTSSIEELCKLHKDSSAYCLKFHIGNWNSIPSKMRQPLSMYSTLQCSQLISFSSSRSTMVATRLDILQIK